MFRLDVNSGITVDAKATFERLFSTSFDVNAGIFLRHLSVYSVILFSKNSKRV